MARHERRRERSPRIEPAPEPAIDDDDDVLDLGAVGEYVVEEDEDQGRRGMYRAHQRLQFDHALRGDARAEGRTVLVHATKWNRLDACDPRTGASLTARSIAPYERDKRPEHYLDYFHAGLVPSPDQTHSKGHVSLV